MILREWRERADGEPYYIEVAFGPYGIVTWWYRMDPRKRQYRRKPKYWQTTGGGFGGLADLRAWSKCYGGEMAREILAIIERSGLTSSMVEHLLRKRERGGSTPPSGSLGFSLNEFAKDFYTDCYTP